MRISDPGLSRVVSHALRHEPWVYELELDEEGWVPIEQLLSAVRERGGDWAPIDRSSLERMILTATKQRHEIVGDQIRALYGHSLPGRIRKEPDSPPATLFHGTAPATWVTIQDTGLLPMGRQYVHLSADRETAALVGRRKSPVPAILRIDTATAALEGVTFYQGNEMVWLAEHIPARFLVVDQEETE